MAYYLEYPDSFEECNKKAYINTERVNVRLTPHITDDNINYTLAFSTNV